MAGCSKSVVGVLGVNLKTATMQAVVFVLGLTQAVCAQPPAATGANLEQFVNAGRQDEANRLLDQLSRTEAVAELCAPFLQDDSSPSPAFTQYAYNMLRNLKGAETDDGFAVLVQGLDDSNVNHQLAALQGLAFAPDSRHGLLGPRLVAIIRDEQQHTLRWQAFRTLAQLRVRSNDAEALAEERLLDEQANKRIRIAAATYLSRALPIAAFLKSYDQVNCEVVLAAMARATGMSESRNLATNAHERNTIRAYLLECLASDEVTCRKTALECVFVLLPDSFVVVRSQTDYEIPEDLRAALEQIADDDPEESLRQRASSLLDPAAIRQFLKERTKSVPGPDEEP